MAPDQIDTIYKYLDPDRLDVLENGTIRASQVELLNDPFEVFPDFSVFEEYLVDLTKQAAAQRFPLRSPIVPYSIYTDAELEQIKRIAKESVQRFRAGISESNPLMVCLSETNNNLLMWSHYARGHAGLVIGFNARHEFFSGPAPVAKHTSRLFKVEYNENRPMYPDPRKGMTVGDLKPIYLRKSIDWAYEKEWRMLVKPEACRSLGKAGYYECFVLDWPRDLLTDIILGPKMSLGDKAKVMELARTRYRHAELFDAKLSATKYNLDIGYMFHQKG